MGRVSMPIWQPAVWTPEVETQFAGRPYWDAHRLRPMRPVFMSRTAAPMRAPFPTRNQTLRKWATLPGSW